MSLPRTRSFHRRQRASLFRARRLCRRALCQSETGQLCCPGRPFRSGKSSVVQAGLFPRLRRDAPPWVTILFPPREDPFLSLAAGFVWHWQPQANYIVNTNEAKKLATELKETQRLTEAINRTVA